MLRSFFIIAALFPAVTLTVFLVLTLVFPFLSAHEPEGKVPSGNSKDKSRGAMQEVDVGICGAAVLSIAILGSGWLGIIVCQCSDIPKVTR
jgi:hypothetical protein